MKGKWRFIVYPISLVSAVLFILLDEISENKWIQIAWFCAALLVNEVFIYLYHRFPKPFGNVRPSIKNAWIAICLVIFVLYCSLFIAASILSFR